ncbi:MAG: hypothetical protein FJ096_10260 [Deltaproteobacteria bacterium]|nr:hypothetical protein [Deltaproteobacteria bacterium]
MTVEETAPSGPPAEQLAGAAEVMLKLDKAARMRRFYDAGHDLVRRFEGELTVALRSYHERFGDLSLRVRPTTFELAEASIEAPGCDEFALSFFRQGVIAVRFQAGVPDEEFGRFISLCATGLQSTTGAQDDLPTLLWGANFTRIQYAAPVGYTEEDGSLRSSDDLFVDQETVSQVIGESLSIDLDRLPPETRKAYEERVAKLKGNDAKLPLDLVAAREAVEAEDVKTLARRTFEALRAVLLMPTRPTDLGAEDVAGLLLQFRRFFLDQADLDGLVEIAKLVQSLDTAFTTSAEDRAALGVLKEQRIEETELAAMLRRVPGGTAENVEKVTRVIQAFGGDERESIAKLADLDRSAKGRKALDEVLGEVAGNDPEYLINRFRSLEGKRAVEALAVLARSDLAQARMAVAVRLPGASDETQLELLEAIHSVPSLLDDRIRAALLRLATKGGALRVRIMESFSAHPDAMVRDAVIEWLKGPDVAEWDSRTLEAAFRLVFVSGDPAPVMQLVTDILERKSLFGRKQLLDQKLAVVTALTATDAADAHALLSRYADGKDKDVAKACKDGLERIAFERARGLRPSQTGDEA